MRSGVVRDLRQAGLSLLLMAMLAGCATTSDRTAAPDEAEQTRTEHRAAVMAQPEWGLTGRLAVRDARQGGTGALRWHHDSERDVLEFRAGLGAGAWRLSVPAEGLVELETGGGERFTGSNVEQVLRQHLGWTLPVAKFRFWVRGVAGPGSIESSRYDRRGRLQRLQQDGWRVEFDDYSGTLALPGDITAESGEYSVRLLVQGWRD